MTLVMERNLFGKLSRAYLKGTGETSERVWVMTTENRVFLRHVMSNISGRYNPPFIHASKELLPPAELGDYRQFKHITLSL